MQMIAAVDSNWGIGNRGRLLVSIPQDQKNFRELTMGGVVIGGRKTMEGLPGGRPLTGRRNILLTRRMDYQKQGMEVAHSVEEVLQMVQDVPPERIFVIGGEQIYRLFLPYCQKAYITKIDYHYEADAHCPDLTKEPGWKLTHDSEEQTYFDLEYYFQIYQRSGRTAGDENSQ